MSDGPTTRIDVNVGDVSHSQLVIGDHNTVQTPKGTRVTVLQVGRQPVPRLRATPIGDHVAPRAALVGRARELELLSVATPGAPVELFAPEGTGKTAALKSAVLRDLNRPGGAVFLATRRRSLDDIQSRLFTAFYECDTPFLPGPAQVGSFLAGLDALLALDDCALDRDDLEVLLDSVATCSVVLASAERTLWSRGTAHQLPGLDQDAAAQLIERELRRPLDPGERQSAVLVSERLGGHPQSLVEITALVLAGRASFADLASDPAPLDRSADLAALTDGQRRMLAVLAPLAGASLGVDHIATLAEAPDAATQLDLLERSGWVKSSSPRYRLARALPGPDDDTTRDRVEQSVLAHLAGWSRQAEAAEVGEEAEAIEVAVSLGSVRPYREAALSLALAAEPKLAAAGAWTTWRHVLVSGRDVARSLGNAPAEAQLLHQLGSRAMCLGDPSTARDNLQQALEIRQRLDDPEGVEVTRHNLRQLGGGTGAGGDGWRRWALIGLAVVALIALVIVLVTGGSKDSATTPTTTVGPSPTVVISSPASGTTYASTAIPKARYRCAAAAGAQIKSCVGSVPVGQAVAASPGAHHFNVTATDSTGLTTTKTISYAISKPTGAPPVITISSPANGATLLQGSTRALAQYQCSPGTDNASVTSCTGTVGEGVPLDTSSPGSATFTVTAKSASGGRATQTVTYTVEARTAPTQPSAPTSPANQSTPAATGAAPIG